MVSPSTPASILSYADAALIVRQRAEVLRSAPCANVETVSLLGALGRVLAVPVLADRDQPPFHRATRDGFACRAADSGRPLRVMGQIRAGDPQSMSAAVIDEGEAVEIMTGAPVPEGADCVVMVEHASHDTARGIVRVDAGRRMQPGENIVAAGAEARQGAIILRAGTRIEANHIGAAAACGYLQVLVHGKPRVAILATGDELVEVDEPVQPYQIRNSNSYSLAAQVVSAGAESVRLPIAADKAATIEAGVRAALDCDLVLLSGGVSAGRYDLVGPALLSMGAEFLFTGVLMQPGKPVVFGRIPHADGYRYFFGLPGNPVSTLVTFTLFVRPLLDALAGAKADAPRFVQARLREEVKVKPGLTRFLPALLRNHSGSGGDFDAAVAAIPWHGSGDLANTARANCFLVVPADREVVKAGEMVAVLLS